MAFVLLLGGCSTIGGTTVVSDTKSIPIIHPPMPVKPKTKKVKLNIYHIQDSDKNLKNKFDSEFVIIMDLNNIEKLGHNIKSIVEYASNLKNTIEYYRSVSGTETKKPDDEPQ